jgi:hypothetical protein
MDAVRAAFSSERLYPGPVGKDIEFTAFPVDKSGVAGTNTVRSARASTRPALFNDLIKYNKNSMYNDLGEALSEN